MRLQLVEELAAKGGPLPPDTLQKIALIQSALTAVREEIKNHEVKVGGGGASCLLNKFHSHSPPFTLAK